MKDFDYSEVKSLLAKYGTKFSGGFSSQQEDFFEELTNKLNDLDTISKEIVSLVSNLSKNEKLIPNQDDEIEIMGFKIKLQRADPNVPIQLDNTSKAYLRGEKRLISKEDKIKEEKLERLTSEFYTTAHRVVHIVGGLPDLKSFKATSIRIVRNQLIEHPEGSGVTYDSFSYTKNEGPYIKGLRKDNQIAHMDKGFKMNNQEFLDELKSILTKVLN